MKNNNIIIGLSLVAGLALSVVSFAGSGAQVAKEHHHNFAVELGVNAAFMEQHELLDASVYGTPVDSIHLNKTPSYVSISPELTLHFPVMFMDGFEIGGLIFGNVIPLKPLEVDDTQTEIRAQLATNMFNAGIGVRVAYEYSDFVGEAKVAGGVSVVSGSAFLDSYGTLESGQSGNIHYARALLNVGLGVGYRLSDDSIVKLNGAYNLASDHGKGYWAAPGYYDGTEFVSSYLETELNNSWFTVGVSLVKEFG